MRDGQGIERAMGSHADSVWRACLVYLPPSEAEDVFQETFLKYAQHDEPFADEEHVRAWLLRVAINGCKDVLRSARRQNVSLDERMELLGDEGVRMCNMPEGTVYSWISRGKRRLREVLS